MEFVKLSLLAIVVASPANAESEAVEVNLQALEALRKPFIENSARQEMAYIPPPPRAPEIYHEEAYREAPTRKPEPPAPEPAAKKSAIVEELEGEFSGTIGLTNDYSFRGITQNKNRPAVQGNLDFKHKSGLKVGAWGSNINFGNGSATLETDIYASYAHDFNLPYMGGLSTETGIIRYAYPGAKSHLHYSYNEFYENLGYDLGFATLGASLNYSPSFTGRSGSAYYPKLAATAPLPYSFAVDGWVGRQYISNNVKAGLPNYTDWSLGLGYNYDAFAVHAQYVDTNISKTACLAGCGAKGIVIVSKSFK